MNQSSDPNVYVVIPGYFEGERVGEVVKGVKAHCSNIVVVDDGSTDETSAAAATAGAHVLRHEVNQGKGVALQTGFDYALEQGCDAVITLDADGQHAPDEIVQFIAAFQKGEGEVLVGNRMENTRDMPLVRRWTNQFMSWLLSRKMGQRVPDTQNGYRMYSRASLQQLDTVSSGFAAESEQLIKLARAGFKIGAVPVSTIYGDEKSKINPFSDTLKFFAMLRRYK